MVTRYIDLGLVQMYVTTSETSTEPGCGQTDYKMAAIMTAKVYLSLQKDEFNHVLTSFCRYKSNKTFTAFTWDRLEVFVLRGSEMFVSNLRRHEISVRSVISDQQLLSQVTSS